MQQIYLSSNHFPPSESLLAWFRFSFRGGETYNKLTVQKVLDEHFQMLFDTAPY